MAKYIWSLDISTTNIGSTLVDNKGKLIELKHLELKIDKDIDVENRYIYKAKMFEEYILEYKERILKELNGEVIHIIVEEPLGSSNNINTAMLLAAFNGICCYTLFKVFGIYPERISVHESRVLFCDELVRRINKKNKKTGSVEVIETISFPKEYLDKKKLYIWEKVCKLEPQIIWYYKKDGTPKDMCFDMSDSYCCSYAWLKRKGIIK